MPDNKAVTYHVTPNEDIHTHEQSTTCKCEPRVEFIDGNMVVIHNAFDGREGVEWAEEILQPDSKNISTPD